MTRIAIEQETLELALAGLQECKSVDDNNRGRHQAIAAIKQTLAAQPATPAKPMQPVVIADDGVVRFKANAIVQHLIDTHQSCDMNKLSCMDFTDEDRMQFAQLIGYSLGGYGDLSYVSDESYEAAEKAAHSITAAPEKGQS